MLSAFSRARARVTKIKRERAIGSRNFAADDRRDYSAINHAFSFAEPERSDCTALFLSIDLSFDYLHRAEDYYFPRIVFYDLFSPIFVSLDIFARILVYSS